MLPQCWKYLRFQGAVASHQYDMIASQQDLPKADNEWVTYKIIPRIDAKAIEMRDGAVAFYHGPAASNLVHLLPGLPKTEKASVT